jgi:hypothetical protein
MTIYQAVEYFEKGATFFPKPIDSGGKSMNNGEQW